MNNNYFSSEFIKKFSFPRMAGTTGEKKAQHFLEKEIEKLGDIEFQKQPFSYNTLFGNILLRCYDIFVAIFMISVFICLIYENIIIAVLLSFPLFIISYFSREIRLQLQFRLINYGKERKSQNFIIGIPPSNEKNVNYSTHQNIIIFAHYDSISHTLHPILAGAMFFFSLVGGSFFSLHVISFYLLYIFQIIEEINMIWFLYAPIIAVFISLQVFNFRGNKSFGTLDNATGVASSLYLLHHFKAKPLKNSNLVVVLTGVEEFGDIGAFRFMEEYGDQLDNERDLFLIIDSIGSYNGENIYFYAQGLPKNHFSPRIEKEIVHLRSELSDWIKLDPMYIPPLIPYNTDHAPLKPLGFEYMIFGSNGKLHTEKDNLENYSSEVLDNFNRFCVKLVDRLDKKE